MRLTRNLLIFWSKTIHRSTTKIVLFPLLDIHLHATWGYGDGKGAIIVVYIFTLIAIFVLLIACINFINLSTAKASSRSKEIGIKKVAGAARISIIVQFMLESLLLVALAMVLALILVGLSIGLFNNVSGKRFTLIDLFQVKFVISYIFIGIVAAIISGIYPAFFLSSFKPVKVLKGVASAGKGQWKTKTRVWLSYNSPFDSDCHLSHLHVFAAEIPAGKGSGFFERII